MSRYKVTWECCTPSCQERQETTDTYHKPPRVGDEKKISRCGSCLSAWHKIIMADLLEAAA